MLPSQVQPESGSERVASGTTTIGDLARFGQLVEYLSAFVLFVARCGSVEFKYRGFRVPARASFASIFPRLRKLPRIIYRSGVRAPPLALPR